MLPIVFPEFKKYEQFIDRIICKPFNELNAYYYLKFGKNFIVDIAPDSFFCIGHPDHIAEFDDYIKQYKEENINYSLAIAERIWQFEKFKQNALESGYSESEADEIHNICINLLKEHFFFAPLEKKKKKKHDNVSFDAMMPNSTIIDHLFSHHSNEIELLPQYVFENRNVVKKMVSKNGALLQLTPKFCADYEIVLAAVRSNTYAVKFIDKSLWENRTIAQEAARHSKYNSVFFFETFKHYNDDNEIVTLALQANGANIAYTSDRIKNDYKMAVIALNHQFKHIYPNSVYKSLSFDLRSRKDLAMLELKSPCPSLDGFTDELLDDDDIALMLIENKEITYLFYQMSERIQRKYLDKLPQSIQSIIKEYLHI